MKIALLGYGKMGKTIERIAQERGHKITLVVDRDMNYTLSNVDIAIDFSVADVAVTHLNNCLAQGIPVVSGTTGWMEQYEEVAQRFRESNTALLYASNFSVGVNLFFEVNQRLAKLLAPHEQYSSRIHEIHHIHKIDSPSGTAITLAENIIAQEKYTAWKELENPEEVTDFNKKNPNTLPITSARSGEVPGTHIVTHQSKIDTITLSHEAHSREGFALGAVVAAEWLLDKKGVFSMRDVLNIS